MRTKHDDGFTLLEILIALAIFALLAVITSGAIRQAIQSKTLIFKQMEETRQLQFALTLLSRDTLQSTARSILGEAMHAIPPLIGQPSYLEFTRTGRSMFNLAIKPSPYLRVAYLCENDRFIRRTFPEVDAAAHDGGLDETLLTDLSTCRFAYLNATLQVLPIWRAGAVRQSQHLDPLPKAVQLTLHHKLWGNMVSLFILPEAVYVNETG